MARSYTDTYLLSNLSDCQTMISTNHFMNSLDMAAVCWCGRSSRPGVFTDWCSTLFEMLKPPVALDTTHAFLPVSLLQQFKCSHKSFPKFEAEFHTHVLFHRRCDAPAHFWGCSSTNTTCSGMREAAVCCQNFLLRNCNSHILLSMAIFTPFAKFGLFLNPPRILRI